MNSHVLLAICWLVAAAMNVRAPYAALAGFPDEWRWILAIVVSLPLTFFVEFAISHDVTLASCKRDIRKDLERIDAKRVRAQETGNELLAVRAEAEQEVFDAVLKNYLHQKAKGLVVFSVALLLVEYAAVLFYLRFQGENGDWITYLVPLLGIILTVVTGLYTGKMIDYPQQKRKISKKFESYAQQRLQENAERIRYASKEFWILEGLTQFALENLNASPEKREREENLLWCEQLFSEFHTVLKQWQAAVQAKKRELNQAPAGLIHRGERERHIQEEIALLNEFYNLELHRLRDEMAWRGCPIEPPQNTHLPNGNGAAPPTAGEFPTSQRQIK